MHLGCGYNSVEYWKYHERQILTKTEYRGGREQADNNNNNNNTNTNNNNNNKALFQSHIFINMAHNIQ